MWLGGALAAMAAAPDTPGATSAMETGVSLLRLLGGFLLVVALFLTAAWAFRRWQHGGGLPRRQAPRLRVMESRALSPRHTLYVVAYDQSRFLVAASPAGLTLVSTLPEDTTVPVSPSPAAASFTEVLQHVLARS